MCDHSTAIGGLTTSCCAFAPRPAHDIDISCSCSGWLANCEGSGAICVRGGGAAAEEDDDAVEEDAAAEEAEAEGASCGEGLRGGGARGWPSDMEAAEGFLAAAAAAAAEGEAAAVAAGDERAW